jgi:hypothetical protein
MFDREAWGMEGSDIRPAARPARFGLRLVVAGIVGLGLSTGAAGEHLGPVGPDLDGTAWARSADVAPARSTEDDDRRRSEIAVLPWKLGAPNLTFEGYERIINAASGGLADISPAAKGYDFADYMFVIDGTGVGIYWEEVSAERPTVRILDEVVAMFEAICEGKSTSGQLRREANDTFSLRQGYLACQGLKWDSHIAVSALNFGTVTRIFVTIGRAENREVLDLINSNIADVEIKVFRAQ